MAALQPVDAAEVTLVVDNYVDVLAAGAEGVRRFPLAYDFFDHDQLVAEHGFSALVTVESGGSRSSILYDGGMTPGTARSPSRPEPSCTCPRPAGPTWRPRAWRWWRSAAPPCCSTTRC
jgi:hypothetical protein